MENKKFIALGFFLVGAILLLGTVGPAGLFGVIGVTLSLPYLVYKNR